MNSFSIIICNLSACLSVYLFFFLSVCLSICLSIYTSIHLSVCLSLYVSFYHFYVILFLLFLGDWSHVKGMADFEHLKLKRAPVNLMGIFLLLPLSWNSTVSQHFLAFSVLFFDIIFAKVLINDSAFFHVVLKECNN